ncbi:sugar phosphate isomerase/epimerase family protein [Rubinisphaera sp.]|uniref:sugar phosphate isomerase/epimerase family protein n=1 Tax=Rubinisphaera sp. TaxID=2024857 RepID=UPI000C0FB2F4|nr:sugar phosphate isomerase/epimerase family protein [Rubinisphaera sp.]MBV11019.1 xylose isomerase [Rubinisphaera sp.]|tara:strand:+ start:254 stop:1165 length:912 start_codon:yes stop_codon:yes gene_type:complete
MTIHRSLSRRGFLQGSAALAASIPVLGYALPAQYDTLQGRFYKTLKIGMVKVNGSLVDKFRAAKDCGFDGIELSAPGFDIAEVNQAIKEVDFPVDGTVCAGHWGVRHTDPDPAVRAEALKTLKQALRDTHAIGGHTVLLVVGHGKDGTPEECWGRSVENIAQAVPLAAELGVHIAIENVWNQFLYDHDGNEKQSADLFVKYVDEFHSPWVGMQFDIGNHWKYGNAAEWIEQLDHRIIKLDVKGFSRKDDKFTKIGEGDIDWPAIQKALLKINFQGWCAAEVGGGDLERLKEVSANMDKAFGLI